MANITFSQASGINDSIYGKSQAPIRAFLEKRGEAFEAAAIGKLLFKENKSNHYGEKFTSLTGMDGFQPVGENGGYPVDGMQESYSKTLEHITWKNSFSISREMIEDTKLLNLRKQPGNFIASYYRTRELYAAALIGKAVSGADSVTFMGRDFDLTAADGLSLFNAAHTAKIDGVDTQCNLYADDFSADKLGVMQTVMQNFHGDNGEILDVSPDTIIIPNNATSKKAVFEALGSDKQPDTANNAFNYQFGMWNVIVWPYLNNWVDSGDAPWILFDSRYNELNDGCVWLDRVPLDVRSYVDEGSDANVWKGYARFIAGFVDWRAVCVGGIDGATSL